MDEGVWLPPVGSMRGGASSTLVVVLALLMSVSAQGFTPSVGATSSPPHATGGHDGEPSTSWDQTNTPGPPVAYFIARDERMTAFLDATGSVTPGGGVITSYLWDFGDGATGAGSKVSHTYSTPGRYTVVLNVTDSSGGTAKASRFVSPASTTVDILADQFFQAECPYAAYWYPRNITAGEKILSDQVPCSNYVPWVYTSYPSLQAANPSWINSMYRYDARVRNHPGYSLREPVILPVFNASAAPGSYLQLNLSFNYMDAQDIQVLSQSPYRVSPTFGDGWGYLVRGTLTMDLQTSKRIFGVQASTPTQAQRWWWANTLYAHDMGPLEKKYDAWVSGQGNGKYDIYDGFDWYLQTDVTDLNTTVAVDGTTTVTVFMDGWGYEVLLARWFYWGNASYRDAVCVVGSGPDCNATLPYGAIQPRGWMPFELCWCEQATIQGRITNALDLDYRAVQVEHLMAWANWGRDGTPGTSDDRPAWVIAPFLMDYIPRYGSGSPASGGYHSELRWYEGLTSVHGTPGSYAYGSSYEYMEPPARWPLNTGSTLTVVLPTFNLTWYDPVSSRWDPQLKIGDYVSYPSPLVLGRICADPSIASTCSSAPMGPFYLWDNTTKVISMAGPYDWGTTAQPLQPSPWIELAPLVYNPPPRPVASFTYTPASPVEGQTVFFNASSSYSPNGSIVSYAWTFGDGGVGYGVNATHAYAYGGTYNVTLLVTDNRNVSAYIIHSVIVTHLNRPPVAYLYVSPTAVRTLETVTAYGGYSYDPDDFFFRLLFNIDWGDGSTNGTFRATHTYLRAGTYVVTLTVTDPQGASSNASQGVAVSDRPPVASLTYNPDDPHVGQMMHFDASTSYDPDGVIISYRWAFDDGATATGRIVDHGFATAGEHLVNVTVVDDSGSVASTIARFFVSQRILEVRASGGQDYTLRESVRVKIVAIVTDASTHETISNATVTIQTYDDGGTPWVSSTMPEVIPGSGIYQWQSSGTIKDLGLKKGVYLAVIRASVAGGAVAVDVFAFHIDPPAEEAPPPYAQPYYDIALAASIGVIAAIALALRRRRG